LAGLDGALVARMSGSGATCFALFSDRAAAEAARAKLAAAHPQWWCAAGSLIRGTEGLSEPRLPPRHPARSRAVAAQSGPPSAARATR
jgi:hypothetical protein